MKPIKEGVSGLLDAVEESRKRQADLSSVLRENVRQAVEFLLEEVSSANRTNSDLFARLGRSAETGPALTDAEAHEALLQATVRVVMRLVVCLFAESRQLLPVNDPIYAQSYGVRSLYELLEEAVRNEGGVHAPVQPQYGLAPADGPVPADPRRLGPRCVPDAGLRRCPVPARRRRRAGTPSPGRCTSSNTPSRSAMPRSTPSSASCCGVRCR